MLLLLLLYSAAAGTLAGSGIGVGSLTPHRQAAFVTQAAVTADFHEPFDVHGNLGSQGTFHVVFILNNVAKDFFFLDVQISYKLHFVYIGFLTDLFGKGSANTIDIGKTNEEPFGFGNLNTCNMCQVGPPF